MYIIPQGMAHVYFFDFLCMNHNGMEDTPWVPEYFCVHCVFTEGWCNATLAVETGWGALLRIWQNTEKIGTWSLEQPIESKSMQKSYNQASKDTRHHFVTCWFDKIMFAGSNHLLSLINSWLKLLTGIWFAGSGSQCALWSLWDCTHLRATSWGPVRGTTSGAQEHLPDSQFCRICGCQRDVLTSAFYGLTLVDSVLSKYVKNSGAYM